jgi:serine/threonine-protein kinase PRP4
MNNDTNVNRRSRLSPSFSPRSPASGVARSPSARRRSRSRTRSPYRRGGKRRRYDDYDDYDDYRHGSSSYRDSYDRRYDSRRQRTYHDYDRDDSYNGGLRYMDHYDRRDKRQKTRSRSPFRDVRKPKKYDDADDVVEPRKVAFREQSVSERGVSPVVAQNVKPHAEPEHQVESSTDASGILNGCVLHVPRFSLLRLTDGRSSSDVTAEAPEEVLDEAARLEARRKRREAIKAKYRGQDALRIQALHQGADPELTPVTPMSTTGKPLSSEPK